ncbi:hypothetical protein IQ07DRAFT_318153 [Pyrenochaeta sp. DS3sAY3a]|nr:hypothetical protein IQ07DRAFT_318153 [Pyrenochaeta sp. DS3sAY3a]
MVLKISTAFLALHAVKLDSTTRATMISWRSPTVKQPNYLQPVRPQDLRQSGVSVQLKLYQDMGLGSAPGNIGQTNCGSERLTI